jgi:miniconductance mechanosensitive channel
MTESGGRRIKRAISIDMNSIRFCTGQMLERFRKIQFITEYIEKKKEEIAAYNKEQKIDDSVLVNGRRMTNIGTFRAYIHAYLRNHPKIRRDMTFLIRQLKPTEHGLPIEIYVFSSDLNWVNYEAIQADIFDHILAVVPEFDLKVYQAPSGHDLGALTGVLKR